MTDKFMQFIQEQTAVASDETAGAMSIEQDKRRWLSKLDELKKLVNDWLNAYVEKGIKTSTRMVPLTEEQTGTYQAPQIEITVGQAVVKLKPIGTFLIGAWGRVDMEGPRGVCRLILVPKRAKNPLFAFDEKPIPEQVAMPDLVWKIMPAPPALAYIELTREMFLDMLMKVVRGE
ncbi:hypothetical protein [Burkholderia sp. LMU1-1-1.1]|uniref:hypothetical protein n=1 Tax=Burkholderia sp. LMU1-1-1.1 TaxID=3135266 RepID=UPI00341236CE